MQPVVQLVPPLSDVPWSSDFVAQSLETLFVCLRADRASRPATHPRANLETRLGSRSRPRTDRVGCFNPVCPQPPAGSLNVVAPRRGSANPTYVVAVEPPDHLSEYLIEEPVMRSDLARGDALGPPTDIDVSQVIEHAFRHLSWLVKDDAVVSEALADWASFLDRYEPEPFLRVRRAGVKSGRGDPLSRRPVAGWGIAGRAGIRRVASGPRRARRCGHEGSRGVRRRPAADRLQPRHRGRGDPARGRCPRLRPLPSRRLLGRRRLVARLRSRARRTAPQSRRC